MPLFVNSQFAQVFAYSGIDQVMLDGDLSRLFDLDTQANPQQAFYRGIAAGTVRNRALLHRPDGTSFVADVFTRPILWDDEPAIAMAIMDVTSDEAARRTLLHAKSEADGRAKRRFLAATSHELRTPLHAAMGRLQLLRTQELPLEAHEMAEKALRACHRLLHQVDDILDCSALEAGAIALASEPFPPARAIEEAVTIAKDVVDGVSIVPSIAGDPTTHLLGDERRTRRLTLALLEEATARGPIAPIEVQACMDSEGRSNVVQTACANAQMAGAPAAAGCALTGMAMARMLTSAMGGVLVERAPERHLWSVTAYLPLQSALAPSPTPAGSVSPRILIVEDNASNRPLLLAILRTLGCQPHAVIGGAEAVAEMAQVSYDLVLMDLSMPGVDGFEATRRIRELPTIAAQTPILALTASCAPGVREPAQDAGMDGFLQKPVDIKRLAAAIAQLATQSQAAPQSARPKFRMFNKTTATIKTTIVVSAAIRLPLEK